MAKYQVNVGGSNYEVDAPSEDALPEIVDTIAKQTPVKADVNDDGLGRLRWNADHPIASGLIKTGEDLAAIPFHFGNQYALNAPRSIINTLGGNTPDMQEVYNPTNPVANVLAKTAGVVGGAMSPVNRLIAGAKTLPQMIAGGAAVGAAYSPNDNFMDGKQRTHGAILGGALGGALNRVENAPKAMKDAAGRIYDFISKIPAKGFAYGKDPLAVMSSVKVTGNTIHDMASGYQSALSESNKLLKEAVSKSPARLDISGVVNGQIDAALQDLTKSTNVELAESTTKKLLGIKEKLNKDYNLSDVSLQEATNIKKQLAKDHPFAYTEPKTSTSNAVPSTAHQIYHGINELIDKAAPNVAGLNERVASLIDITKATSRRAQLESGHNPIGLLQNVAGAGVGAAVGHNVEGVVAGIGSALALKASASPAVLSRVAKTLSTLSDADKLAVFKAYPALKEAYSRMK